MPLFIYPTGEYCLSEEMVRDLLCRNQGKKYKTPITREVSNVEERRKKDMSAEDTSTSSPANSMESYRLGNENSPDRVVKMPHIKVVREPYSRAVEHLDLTIEQINAEQISEELFGK